MEVTNWKTSELLEFLNSYNRTFKTEPEEALKYQSLYVDAFAELLERQPLLAMLY
jgi:hypothetical protein